MSVWWCGSPQTETRRTQFLILPHPELQGSMRDPEAFKPAGIKRRVIAAGIGRLMVISSLSIWIFLRNWDAIIKRRTSWTTAETASWRSLAASIRFRLTGILRHTTRWIFDAWSEGKIRSKDLRRRPRSMTFSTGLRDPQLATFLLISSNVIMAQAFPMQT